MRPDSAQKCELTLKDDDNLSNLLFCNTSTLPHINKFRSLSFDNSNEFLNTEISIANRAVLAIKKF